MKTACLAAAICLVSLCGCFSSNNPDAIREHTADATAAAKRDSAAIAKGIFDGLKRKSPIDLNKASRRQLMGLPKMTAATADSIIAGRPYADPSQLVHRHILSRPDYDSIRTQIYVGK